MEIYKLKKDYDYAHLIPDEDSLDLINDGFNGLRMKQEWGGHRKMYWDFNESTLISDFSMLGGLIPVVDKRVLDAILPIVKEGSIELLPVKVDMKDLFAINVLYTDSNILNKKKSRIDYYSDKSIMFINEYVFNNIVPHSIFKIPQLLTHTFVSGEFKNVIEKEKLTGVEFVKCKIKSKGWFNF